MLVDTRKTLRAAPVFIGALVIGLPLGCAPSPSPPDLTQQAAIQNKACGMSNPTIADLAADRGKTFGTAYRSTYAANDPCYEQVAVTEFNSLTTEIGTMMNTVQPDPKRFDFKEADAVAALAERTGRDFQIHSLIWDPLDQQQWKIVPDTIKMLPPDQRHQLMLDSISTVMGRYAGKSSTVTVVNEAFDQMGNLQPTVWWDTTHSDRYIFDAYRAARLADPKALLYYNDHSAETHSDKSNAIYDLVKRLRETTVDVNIDGQPTTKPLIDGMGFQGHMLGGKDQQPSTQDMASNLQRFADLGLDIRFTELDVRIPVVNGKADPADLERQRQVYKTMTDLCLDQPKCTGITLWGFTDKRSWITDYPESFSGYGAALPLSPRYERKPAWAGITDALENR